MTGVEARSTPVTYRCLRSFLRHYPLIRPRARLLNLLPSVPRNCRPFRIKHGLTIDECYGGDDPISKSIFWLGDFDPWVDRALWRLSRPGDTVIDVGGNVGTTTLCMARRVGPSGKVYTFEPFPPHIAKLKRNIESNDFKQVVLKQLALSSTPGTLTMFMPDDHRQAMSRVGQGDVTSLNFTVEADAFDNIALQIGLDKAAVCKIDVEGHESEVFAGMSRTLALGTIESFVFERHLASPGSDEILNMLRTNGYRVYRLYKRLCRAVPFECATSDDAPSHGEATVDYVAVRKESEAERRWGMA